MASRTVRRVKRNKEFANSRKGKTPTLVVKGRAAMRVKAPRAEGKNAANLIENTPHTISMDRNDNDNTPQRMYGLETNDNLRRMDEFNVSQLIAELSQNSKASKDEIEKIQRRLLQQANDILKVNVFANSLNVTENEPRIVHSTPKYDPNKPVYGRIPVIMTKPQTLNGPEVSRQKDHQDNHPQLVPERLQEHPFQYNGAMINAQGNMHRVSFDAPRPRSFFYETGSTSAAITASTRATPNRGIGGGGGGGGGGVESVPPYRMPPAPEAALPGAPAPLHALHTHSNKFPIEREVILSSGDKSPKVPVMQEARRLNRGRLGAVAPDTPPKPVTAWSHAENQASTSGENLRQSQYQDYSYAIHQPCLPRNLGYDTPKPPVPAKNYTTKPETPPQSQTITVTVETGKDNTRDAPKSTKSVSKTYHTLKDMISSRFKTKENGENDKSPETEQSLNNSEERKRPEIEIARETVIRKEQIYGRPTPQNRPDMQYAHASNNSLVYASPALQNRQMLPQHQLLQQQQQMMHQARSQEMLAARPQALGADALYQQYGPPGRRSALYQRDLEVRAMANFTSLKTGPQAQFDNSHSRSDLRSPQQLEREIIRQRGFTEGRRASSHPHLLDDPSPRPQISTPPQHHNKSRRNSHGNLLEPPNQNQDHRRPENDERESDDGGFRSRLPPNRTVEDRIRTSGRSNDSQTRIQENGYRRTPDKERRTPDSIKRRTPDRRTPDSIAQRKEEIPPTSQEKNDESGSQKSADSVYHSSGKTEAYTPQPSSRLTPSRIEDLKAHGKKGAGSGASSDYDKSGGQSSNVDSGRGSVAYSSGRRPEALHDTSADSDTVVPSRQPQPSTSQQTAGPSGENEWADMVECELRQILEPKLAGMRLDSSGSETSVTPPLPPLSPSSDRDHHKRNSLPARSSEYPEDRRRGRESPRWHAHKKHSSKRDHHYKKHLFGLDTTDMTSTTTRSLDLSSMLDGRTDSDASTGDARAIRRQLKGLETMYAEVLQLLGVRKPNNVKPSWESRLSSKRRYGSMSSLPSSSVSSRPVRDKRRSSNDHRKKNDMKGINKRFQRLESHVVTLARSVAHLSSEMRTQHLVMQEMDNIRAEITALRHMYKSQQYIRTGQSRHEPSAFSNPERVKRLTKFFGDEPPLMRLFLKKLGYEKYAALLEKEKVGAAELPYVGEDKLRALGVPLGPRMRILKEAGLHQELHYMRDDPHTTTTTLAIV